MPPKGGFYGYDEMTDEAFEPTPEDLDAIAENRKLCEVFESAFNAHTDEYIRFFAIVASDPEINRGLTQQKIALISSLEEITNKMKKANDDFRVVIPKDKSLPLF